MKNILRLSTILSVTAITTLHSEELTKTVKPPLDPCVGIYQHVATLVEKDPERIVEIVSEEVSANQSCSCEVVKAAIVQSLPDAKSVAAIVEAAILAAPEQMRMTAQCAIAVAPDAIAEIQAIVARLDPNRGDAAGKSDKSAKIANVPLGDVANATNPLDFPGNGPVGPAPGGPGGIPLFPPIVPTVINPPVVTPVDP